MLDGIGWICRHSVLPGAVSGKWRRPGTVVARHVQNKMEECEWKGGTRGGWAGKGQDRSGVFLRRERHTTHQDGVRGGSATALAVLGDLR